MTSAEGLVGVVLVHPDVAPTPLRSYRARPVRRRVALSHCPVSAAGVLAEWVEATAASIDQPTLVYFHDEHTGSGFSTSPRLVSGKLAAATGARVFRIGCRGLSDQAGAEDGLAAYTWLLGEGLDLSSTVFIGDLSGLSDPMAAVLRAARDRMLPLPAAVVRLRRRVRAGSPIPSTPPLDQNIDLIADWLREHWQ